MYKTSVKLYVDDPDSERPWEISWMNEDGDEQIIQVRSVLITHKNGRTAIDPTSNNKDQPRCYLIYDDARISWREGSFIAFID
jgi:hypothetical protein